MTTRTFTAAEMAEKAASLDIDFAVPEGWPTSTEVRLNIDAQEAQQIIAMLRQATAAAEREAALQKENERLTQEREDWLHGKLGAALVEAITRDALAAERQKIQALRAQLEGHKAIAKRDGNEIAWTAMLLAIAELDQVFGKPTEPTPPQGER